MAHELSEAVGEVADEFGELGGAGAAGQLEAGEVVGGLAAVLFEDHVEAFAGTNWRPREVVFTEPGDFAGGSGGAGDGEVEGAADPGDLEFRREAGDGVEDGRKEVGVFVGIEMEGLEAAVEDAEDLGAEFGVGQEDLGGDGGHHAGDGAGEIFTGTEEGLTADEDEVAADVEVGIAAGELDGGSVGGAVGHKGGGGEDAALVSFDDAGVDVVRETEVVGVHHQASHDGLLPCAGRRGTGGTGPPREARC